MTVAPELSRPTTEAELGSYYLDKLTPMIAVFSTDDISVLSKDFIDFRISLQHIRHEAGPQLMVATPREYMSDMVAYLSNDDRSIIDVAASLLTHREEKIDLRETPFTPKSISDAFEWTDLDWINFQVTAIDFEIQALNSERKNARIYGGTNDIEKLMPD